MSRRVDARHAGATARPGGRPRRSRIDSEPKPSSRGTQAATLLRSGVAALRKVNSTVQKRLNEVHARLKRFTSSAKAVRLDPALVRPSRWGGRHEATFLSPTFQRFKVLIQNRQGNVQPILVREAPDLGYEIVFGHRRHRACLELGLPVLAVIWKGDLSDEELFAAMVAENCGRLNPSAFDQGTMFAAALSDNLYFTRSDALLVLCNARSPLYHACSTLCDVTVASRWCKSTTPVRCGEWLAR
jgi:ParB family transcriptional regulator, chromosome partitioning protein